MWLWSGVDCVAVEWSKVVERSRVTYRGEGWLGQAFRYMKKTIHTSS